MTNLLFGLQGGTNRAKFWLVALALLVIEFIVLGVLGGSAAMSDDPQQALASLGPVAGIVLVIFALAGTWVTIAVGIKRFHDRNKSAVREPITFVPVIGSRRDLGEGGCPGAP